MKDGYVKFWRELNGQLPDFPDPALKIYVHICLNVRFKGEDKGKLRQSVADMAADVGKSYLTTLRWLNWLQDKGRITFTPAKNQHDTSVIALINFDKCSDRATGGAVIKSDTSTDKSSDKSNDRADYALPCDSKDLPTPYKEEEREERKKGKEEREEEKKPAFLEDKNTDVDNRTDLIKKITARATTLQCKGTFPDAVKEVTKAFTERYNLDAILHCLTKVSQYPPDNPAGYFWHVLRIENGNFNEAETINEHERIKGTTANTRRKEGLESTRSIIESFGQDVST